MREYYEKYLNRIYKKDIDLLFGEGSEISITELSYSTSLKQIVVSAKLIPTNYDFAIEIFPEGLEMVIQELWKFMGIDLDLMLTSSIDH